jgi:hypothetical protein
LKAATDAPLLAAAILMDMQCVLFGSTDSPTDEDVITPWTLRAFTVPGPVTSG